MPEPPLPPGAAELADFLGQRDVAESLALWAEGNERAIGLPAEPWQATGFTDAVAVSVIVRGAEAHGVKIEDDWNLIAKIVSAAEGREIGAHRSALRDAPAAFAERHLVRTRFDTVPVGGAKVVYFQDLAGGARTQRPAALLSPNSQAEAIVELCRTVSRSIATEWNTRVSVSPAPMPVTEFAHRELHHPLSGKGSVDGWASPLGLDDTSVPWVVTAEDEKAMPNPVLLCTGHPALRDRRLSVLIGYGHGDLHLGNIMVRIDGGGHPESFRLIDLSTYSASAPLARDQLSLLLSAVAGFWHSLSESQREALLDDLPRADRAGHPRQDPLLAGLIREIFSTTAGVVAEKGWPEAWHEQYLITLVATALRFTTFENMGPERRWWFFRLAARTAREYFAWAGIPVEADAPTRLRSPFGPTAPAGANTTPPAPEARPATAGAGGNRGLELDGILPGRLGRGRPPADDRA